MADWDQRQLCPDGACVGVIGDDGTCKTCGRAAPGYLGAYREGPAEPDEDDDDDDEDDDSPDDAVHALAEQAEVAIHEAEWGDRTLCTDGACTGVIGAGGKCNVCGRSAA